jgi:glycosyltransferase involved in cell wall biosynthesis
VVAGNLMPRTNARPVAPAAKPLLGLTVAHFGHYDPAYARNRILAKALRRAGASVLEIGDSRRFLARTPRLARAGWAANPDMFLVGFPAHSDVATAKLLSLRRRVPVLFDALVSLWETNVLDRQIVSPRGLAQYRLRLTDRVACSLADAILLDTNSHIEWFRSALGIPAGKLHRIWVGADDELMTPCHASHADDRFTVFFYGSFIPLHGIEHILGAARSLQEQDAEIRFVLCGSGQTLAAMRRLAGSWKLLNVEFLDRRPVPELRRLICESDVCLGIFGTSPKARSVIPNKVFDALACGRPVITGDTPAAHESFTHGKHVLLCPAGNAGALADAIATLKADPGARNRIAVAGHELFKRRFSIDAIADDVARVILDVLDGPRRRTGRS